MGITIVADSVACLLKHQQKEHGIRVMPLKVYYDGTIYSDGVDIEPSKAYELLEKNPDKFNTSPSSPEEYRNLFSEIVGNGSQIVCLTMSEKISTMYNVALLAKDKILQEYPDAKIEIIDTQTVTASEGLIAIAAAKKASTGASFDEVMKEVERVKESVKATFVIGTLKYVYRTGRIPKLAAKVGAMVPIKPVLTIHDGSIHFASAARTIHDGIDHMMNYIKREAGDKPISVAVMHAQDEEEGKKLKERVEKELNCSEAYITEFSPIMGYATGRGALGVAFCPCEK